MKYPKLEAAQKKAEGIMDEFTPLTQDILDIVLAGELRSYVRSLVGQKRLGILRSEPTYKKPIP